MGTRLNQQNKHLDNVTARTGSNREKIDKVNQKLKSNLDGNHDKIF